jgi:tryptophan synthase alpha chain
MSKFVSFITAGDPSIKKTKEFIDVLARHSDIIEIGLPFSDPIAEGEVIEAANIRALENGVTTDAVFEMLDGVDFDKMVILTYINPVYKYGYDKFFARCKVANVYGIIIPDLPYEENGEVLEFSKKYGIHLITLIAPTSAERVKMLAQNATGFIYLVSSLGWGNQGD